MYKQWLLVLIMCLSSINIFAMQTASSDSWLTTSKKIVDTTCTIGNKAVRNAGTYAMPVTIGGVACLAVIYAAVPSARQPMLRAGSWVGNKLYDVYSRICYEIQVRPLLDENNRLEQRVWQLQQQGAELQNRVNDATTARIQLRNQQQATVRDLKAVQVTPAHINQMTGKVSLVTETSARLAELMSNGFGGVNASLHASLKGSSVLNEGWQKIHMTLTNPVPLSLEEKVCAVVPFLAANKALNERDEQFAAALVPLQEGLALTTQQLENIQKQIPSFLRSLQQGQNSN